MNEANKSLFELKVTKYAICVICLTLLMVTYLPMPVSAVDIIVNGHISPTFTATIDPQSSINFNMIVGDNIKNDTDMPFINVTSTSNWYCKVQDKSEAMRGVINDGRMNFLGPGGAPSGKMTTPLKVGLMPDQFTSLPSDGSEQIIYTGAPGIFSQRLAFNQLVLIDDITTGDAGFPAYWQILRITIGATA